MRSWTSAGDAYDDDGQLTIKGVNPYILLFWFRGHILAD